MSLVPTAPRARPTCCASRTARARRYARARWPICPRSPMSRSRRSARCSPGSTCNRRDKSHRHLDLRARPSEFHRALSEMVLPRGRLAVVLDLTWYSKVCSGRWRSSLSTPSRRGIWRLAMDSSRNGAVVPPDGSGEAPPWSKVAWGGGCLELSPQAWRLSRLQCTTQF